MKILYITNFIPYPPDFGSKIRSLAFLKSLSEFGEVTLLCEANPKEDRQYVPNIQHLCKNIIIVDRDQYIRSADKSGFAVKDLFVNIHSFRSEFIFIINKYWSTLKSLLKMQPSELDSYYLKAMEKALLLTNLDIFDLIIVRHGMSGKYFLGNHKLYKHRNKIWIDHDDLIIKMAERKLNRNVCLHKYVNNKLNYMFAKKYYKRLDDFAGGFVCSALDRDYLVKRGYKKQLFIMPNIIEVKEKCDEKGDYPKNDEMLFCGYLGYYANVDGLEYFCKKIMPLIIEEIPNAKLTVIGKNASERTRKILNIPGINFIGYVDNLESHYRQASLAVVPILEGGGTRIKILEAMSFRRPVVSTTIGAEGLEVKDGENILIADTPNHFAQQCIILLRNTERRRYLADNGYNLIKSHYTKNIFHKQMMDYFNCLSHPL